MNGRLIRVGSRDSKLAVLQSKLIMGEIKRAHPELDLELVTMKTTGDLILDKTLDAIGGKGLFVRELDRALREGKVDICVHSLKDVPMELPEDMTLAAYSRRENPRDALILPKGSLSLSPNLPIGTASARRALQLSEIFPETPVKPVRGNVLTRLEKLDRGEYSALVLAFAGVYRAGLTGRICRIFSTQEMIPAAGQGILAVQTRSGEDCGYLTCVNDPLSEAAAAAERSFVTILEGGCSSPTAAYAEIHGEELRLTGFYLPPGESRPVTGSLTGTIRHAEQTGEKLAKMLKGGI